MNRFWMDRRGSGFLCWLHRIPMAANELSMINQEQARELVWTHIHRVNSSNLELMILDEHTIETEFGWVFFWNSRLYIETGEFKYALAGNAPMIVDKLAESVHPTSTAVPAQQSIEEYRRRLHEAAGCEG
jgi:hypothetical protein